MTVLKDTFSIKSEDVDSIRGMLESMAKDLAASYPQGLKKNASQQNMPETTAQQPTATSAEKAVQQAGPATKAHGRSGSKSGQPPSAPTTSQPPFPLGAQSPAGQPTYIGKPTVTQDTLQLPAKKRAKMGPSGAQPATQSNTSSPQVVKQSPPETARKSTPAEAKAPPKPHFLCPQKGCEANNVGFASEESRRQHIEEEHTKPYQNPLQYASENLAAVLGLDASGHSKSASENPDGVKQSQTAGGTPASQSPVMIRQGSVAGSKPGDLMKSMASRTGMVRSAPSNNGIDNTPGDQQTMDQSWAGVTIDPQELFSTLGLLESGGGGAISNMGVYRSISPNDTPDSSTSKESSTSDPSSDVSEGVTLNVTLEMGFDTWTPFGDQYMSMDATDVDAMMSMNDQPGYGLSEFADFTTWDDGSMDANKPFALDASLYSLDTA